VADHEHRWELFSQTSEEEAAAAPEPRALHAYLPVGHPDSLDADGNPVPHDPANKEHVKTLKDPTRYGTSGVEDFSMPPPRKAQDVYVCECGEARHVEPGGSPEEATA
jgi:hypothetical protein